MWQVLEVVQKAIEEEAAAEALQRESGLEMGTTGQTKTVSGTPISPRAMTAIDQVRLL
jgi:hypothetical protein